MTSSVRRASVLAVAVAVAGCGDGGGFPDAPMIDAPPPGGTFSMQWAVDNTSGQSIACDDIGGTSVTALAHNRAEAGGTTEVFSCTTGMGTSEVLSPGTYDIDFELNGQGALITNAPRQMGVIINSAANTPLMPLTFMVEATGALALTLTSNKPSGNCAAPPMGAGITATTITLQHTTGGACAPVMFMITAGATQPAGTYTVDCASPVVAPCIDSDQHLEVSGVASGNYTIHVTGKIGATACWSNNDAFPVPPNGATLTRSLNLADATGTTGC